MKKSTFKKIIIVTVVINVIIFLVIGAKITIQRTKQEIAKQFAQSSQNFSVPKFPGAGGSSLFASGEPVCTDSNDYHAQLVYAKPKDSTSRYQEMVPKLRSWFKSADEIVNQEAKRFGVTAHLKVACNNGEISIVEAELPNTADHYFKALRESREGLTRDLSSLGYNKKNEKYIIYYDGLASGCQAYVGNNLCISQQSEKGPDDRLTEDNIFNFGPDYALLYKVDDITAQKLFGASYDMLAPVLMLHEYAHTMGAVQPTAPHATKLETSKQRHCTDSKPLGQGGTDVMCKSDAAGEVFGNACPGFYPFRFDCNNDDYFNPKPEPGSYLATHWNLGSKLNHFIRFEP